MATTASAGNLGEHPFGFDPYRDWAAARRRELAEAGFELAPGLNDAEVARAYLNARRRLIEAKPRTVHRARSFSPNPEEARAIAEIEQRARAGRDLNAFLTKRSRRVDERDGLLFDWDIHHFHLGLVLEASGFRRRTRRLLFARITDESVYLIAIGQHGHWGDQALFEMMHENWPETLQAFRINSGPFPIQRLSREFSDQERHDLRQAGVQAMTRTRDGTVYFAPGGGIATDGSNFDVTFDLMRLGEYLRFLEAHVRQASDRIRERAWAAGINPDRLRLRLVYDGAQPVAEDRLARVRILLPTYVRRARTASAAGVSVLAQDSQSHPR